MCVCVSAPCHLLTRCVCVCVTGGSRGRGGGLCVCVCVYGGGWVVEALLLYFKFSQSSHAVIFCTAVFVLPVSSHVVISGAFQGPPLKVRRAHNTTSSGHASSCSSTPTRVARLPIRPPVSRAKSGHRSGFISQRVHLSAATPRCLCRHCRSSAPSGVRSPGLAWSPGWEGSGGVGAEVGRRR